MRRRLKPALSAACMRASACAPASMAMVPKKRVVAQRKTGPDGAAGEQPGLQIDPPCDPAQPLRPVPDRVQCRPSRPAAPGRCRCSRSPSRGGYAARGSAGRGASPAAPAASWLTPTRRPGMWRLKLSRVAMKPACGPPKPIGTPKRCAEPTTMSAPISPGGVSSTRASGSAATIASAAGIVRRGDFGASDRAPPRSSPDIAAPQRKVSPRGSPPGRRGRRRPG